MDSDDESSSEESPVDTSSSGEEIIQSEPEVTTDEIFNENISELNGCLLYTSDAADE